MKIHEKLKIMIERSEMPLTELHRRIKELFEDNAIAYLTLYRTVQGTTQVRESTLYQIASALGVRPERIKEGTERERAHSVYRYNDKAYVEIRHEALPFLTGRLVLLPGAKTQTEQDPAEKGAFIKWLYVIQGEIACCVEDSGQIATTTLKKNASLAFNSTKPHHFENHGTRRASAVIIQNPKYL